jgi:hypothetical protein
VSRPFDATLDHKLRDVQRGALLMVLLVALICTEHWLRGDRFFPLWAFALAGVAFAWCAASMWWLRRQMARSAASDV